MGEKKLNPILEQLTRKIHLPSGEWSYSMGGTGVRIRTPDCKQTYYASFTTLLDVDRDEIISLNLKVTPSVIREYIENNLMVK